MPARILLVPYDAAWPQRFEEERRLLADLFAGTAAVIEHIGSTAVPGLGSKPVIDVMVGVPALGIVRDRIPSLEAAGYEYVPRYETQLPERRYFRKPRFGARLFHVHCVLLGSDFWIQHLAFRDHLRGHPEVAAAYQHLKADLATRVTKAEYTEAKSPFIAQVLAAALAASPPPSAAHGAEAVVCRIRQAFARLGHRRHQGNAGEARLLRRARYRE